MDSYRNLKSRRGLCIANILKYLDKNVQKLFKKVPNGSKLLVLGQTCSKIVQKSTYRSFYFISRHAFMISENTVFLKLIFSGYNEDIIGNCNVPISFKGYDIWKEKKTTRHTLSSFDMSSDQLYLRKKINL